MIRIECESVSKHFYRKTGRQLLRSHAMSWFRERNPQHLFYALRDVSFRVESTQGVGIVGRNGAGKSTLLSLITQIAKPDAGTITVNGRVAALLELGSGFHPDLTGAENLMLNAALLGFTRREAKERMEKVIEFSGLEEFIAEPLRTYSTGMVMRLAFSIAMNLDPDILIIDEVLAVGDGEFQSKCLNKIYEFREQGKTILAVSHSPAMLANLCDKAIWLESGRLMMEGEVHRVLDAYQAHAQQAAPATV